MQNVIKRNRQCILFANSPAGYFPCGFSWRAESKELLWELGIPQGIAHSSLSTWYTKSPVPEPPLKEDLLANEVITLMETGPHTGYQNTLPMSYISNLAVIFTIMCLYEDVSVLWCVYRGQKITFRSWLSPFTVQYRDQIQAVRLGQRFSPPEPFHQPPAITFEEE